MESKVIVGANFNSRLVIQERGKEVKYREGGQIQAESFRTRALNLCLSQVSSRPTAGKLEPSGLEKPFSFGTRVKLVETFGFFLPCGQGNRGAISGQAILDDPNLLVFLYSTYTKNKRLQPNLMPCFYIGKGSSYGYR